MGRKCEKTKLRQEVKGTREEEVVSRVEETEGDEETGGT